MIIYSCSVSENYEQLQLGGSSMFLMGGWQSHPRRKILRNLNLGMRVP